ncbi:enoyl-CoA hydratase-related protein [Xanthomonas oryzae pv. oryzicola]|uniref:enoyl-CoA hydratase-related protein n=1 Tax=Xanthomonas oryzae TaxID=347 RepID=UPI0004177EB0|nr:enoyl-CoA hydratase-related protein [Xanthomonas oryzae]AJQ87134.1 enoyl-CoA hydratase [Xanthomonas oryzae pv. oryzicola]AKO01230.1 enoyl-CoA hydratase [Xanthomonas oryzae pv. oryzicola]AKO05044.1 enoyl-CoA hydratase [Xanthomonas oryzae pv. oryzicola]AKO08929.1 enoyl-CoA hydratase [Xanthomonas oryzae pv. oryzicola]KOR55235.1 enoyl-CoA hydratase [Xanthomonas oryzae]
MSNHVILIADHASIRTITINRPDKLNALNQQTMQALDQAFQDAAAADDVRAVILTGAGPKAFVAGADIAEMSDLSAIQGRAFSLLGQQLMRRIERMPKPVIAMINGFALGGGLELAMACHLRIAATTARLGQPEINLGLIPGFGGTQRLLRLTGRAAALELCLLGLPIDAARALQLGLVNRVLEVDALHEETLALAQRLATAAPLALRGILDAVVFGGECAMEEGLQLETAQFSLLFATDDMREGTRAFLDKRPAHFKNR